MTSKQVRLTMLSMLTMFSMAAAQPRLAGVYDKSPEVTDALRAALAEAQCRALPLSADQLCDEHQMMALDLLVIPEARVMPAAAMPVLNTYLKAGKTLLLLGPRPFNEWQYRVGEDWLTDTEIREARVGVESEPARFPPTGEWARSARLRDIPGILETDGGSLHYKVERLSGWDTYAAECRGLFPKGHELLCFRARGNSKTAAMYIEFIEEDHSRWCATAELTEDWKPYILTPRDFKFWHDCHPTRPRGGAGDVLHPAEVVRVNVGLADSHTPWMDGGPLEYFIRDLGTSADTLERQNLMPAEFPVLETFYPAYKQFPLADKAGAYSTPNRFRGRGFNQRAHWRWRPFRLEGGRLVPEENLRRPSHIWLTHFLDGAFKNARVATIAAPVDYHDAQAMSVVTQLAAHLGRPWELTAGGAEAFGMFPDESMVFGVETVFFHASDEPVTATLQIADAQGQTLESRTWDMAAKDGELPSELSSSFSWQAPGADAVYHVSVTLCVKGQVVDSLAHELYVMPPRETVRANAKGFITVEGDNFMLDGKPWYPVGVNYWTSNIGAMEANDFRRAFLAPGFYDPEQVELDLAAMESVGINMISSQLKGDTGSEDTRRNLLDFLNRCQRHGIHVNAFLKSASPFDFNEEQVREVLVKWEMVHLPAIFAYDICWEPGNYTFNANGRPKFDARWRDWIVERYGSFENAVADWKWQPSRSAQGEIVAPTDAQLKTDGDWRIYVAAYRRFMDDVTSRLWNDASRKLRALAPKQLFSFRQGNTLPHDFALTGPVKHLDFICPEGYSIPLSEDGYNAAGFITRYVHYTMNGKPIIWAEFGRHVWNPRLQDVSQPGMENSVKYHELFYRMAVDSGANGTAPWWWPGWYRVNERSDYGIANPDGTPRPQAKLLDTYGPLLKRPRHYPEGDVPFLVDRDAHAGGYWFMVFNAGRDAYRAARTRNRHLKLYSEASGRTSADVPLTAVGNVPYNGSNPPKYLNAEFNWVKAERKDGKLHLQASVGNLTEATWLAGKTDNLQEGEVVLLANHEVVARLSADTPRFADAAFETTLPIPAAGVLELRLAAWHRAEFGEIVRLDLDRR